MANTSDEAAKYEVCFVQTGPDSPEETTEILKLAFEALDTNQLNPVWITVLDCLKVAKKEAKLFVLDPFEGVAFEHLKTFNCRIIGPLCILYCLQYSDVLPRRHHPVYSVSMRKITVSCSNISANIRNEICSRVQLMGGFFSKDLTKSVTHLVVGEVGSQKYKVAASFGIPIMTPDWVTDVWENGQYKQLHATDSYYNKYKCPLFKGLVITVSQLSAEERLAIKSIVEDNGGSYSGALKANDTTHLILSEPTGDKYRFAKSWKVICVRVNWIYESVEAGYCQDESLYPLGETVTTSPKRSTPKKDLTSIGMPLVDCSAIASHPAVSHLDETMKSDTSMMDLVKRNQHVVLDEFNLNSLPKYGQFLDGCKIFLTGFNSVHIDKLRKIVNSGGGMRFSKYSDSISHVVCGELSNDFLKSLKSSCNKPFVVNFNWLLECCKNEKLVDEKPFLCMDANTLSPEKLEVQEIKKDVSASQNNLQMSRKSDSPTDNITDILKQYINKEELEDNKENNVDKCENQFIGVSSLRDNVQSNSVALETKPEKDASENKIQEMDLKKAPECPPENLDSDKHNVTQHCEDVLIDDEVQSLFKGFKFVIVGFGEKDTEILSSMIETHSGVILNEANDSTAIAVVPLVWHCLKLSVSNIVTNCWLQKCIEESRIFDFDENQLFRPFDLDDNKKPFESLVISFSQYVGTERDCLIHLAECLGAVCQDYFVRKANPARGVLSNTHLVVSTPDGSKYDAAKKWKIPAVNKHWVIYAAKMGVVPDVEGYFVDKFPELPLSYEEAISVPKNSKNQTLPSNEIETNEAIPYQCSSFSELLNDKEPNNDKSSSFKCPEKQSTDIKTSGSDNDLQNATNVPPYTPVQHKRVAELCNQSKSDTVNRSPQSKNSELSLNLSSVLDSPDYKFHVSGILKALDASVSRESLGMSKRHSLPVEDMFGRKLVCALQRLDNESSEYEVDSKSPLKKNKEEEKPRLLQGVVLYVSRKLANIQTELNEIVTSLGGDYIWSYNDSCTHFVFVGRSNDLTKEFREARSQGKKVVSPEWLYACKQNGSHVDEETYPHTYKANMSLSQQISIKKVSSECDIRKHENADAKPKTPINEAKSTNNIQSSAKSTNALNTSGCEVDFNKQLNELLVAAKSAKRRHSRRIVSSVSSSPVNDISPIQKFQRHLSDVYVKPAKMDDNAAEDLPDTCSQLSQTYPILWDDPTGRMEREKIAARAAKNAEKLKADALTTEKQAVEPEVLDLGFDTPKKDEVTAIKIKKFMFSNINEALRSEYIEKVKQLGGEVSDEKTFDITATHLIVANPIKNEKFLSSVASGKWVLHPQYLNDSVEQNGFISEEEFEWGGPCTDRFAQNLTENSIQISKCPYRWRSRIKLGVQSSGAFDSWKVLIHADDRAKLATYTKILESGGAEIMSPANAEHNPDRITHVFVDIKRRNSNKIDLSRYTAHNIKCLKPEYLAFFLIEDPPPDAETFLISETKESTSDFTSSKRRNMSSATSRQSKRTKLK